MNPATLLLITFLVLECSAQLLTSPNSLFGQSNVKTETYDPDAICPKSWVHYTTSCYKFIRSPIKTRDEARQYCRAFNSDLTSINSLEEHSFITTYLNKHDPSHRIWYISGHQQSPGVWVNDGDGTTMMNLDTAFLPNQETLFEKDFLSYGYSLSARQWGLLRVDGKDPLLHICEIAVNQVNLLDVEDRTFQYGIVVNDITRIPRGPFFIQQPVPVVFDLTRRKTLNQVTLSCIANGYPTPEFQWYKEDFENDQLVSRRIDPLQSQRHTVSGGLLIINNPEEIRDRGKYHCVASNQYGSIVSESVQLSFGFIGEFNLKRSSENGLEHWGKAIYCDPPQYFPDIQYYWVRDVFPNFVEEDSRTFVSFDGNLYFSSLENIDRGRYSCNVQSTVSSNGRNGPFFSVEVRQHPNYQQLKFPNNFPKSFPEAPRVGEDVRLECVAFGYPVPNYNWTRKGAPLPKGVIITNYNRVLVLPKVKVEDMGDYVCRATNDKVSIEGAVTVSVQATPVFTIPLGDMHMDRGEDLLWTCEAFGIPDVNYQWLRNGQVLDPFTLEPGDRERYETRENVLIIRKLDPERDQAMYQCKASNQIAERYSSGQLRILDIKPSFAKKPLESDIYAADGGNVTIACNPEAAPRPKYMWRKDGFTIGSGGRRIILPSGHLLINPVSLEDSGNFTCTAENRFGSDSSTGRVIVLRGPVFIEEPPSRILTTVGLTEQLRCRASAEGILDLAYIWKHNGITLRFDSSPIDFHDNLEAAHYIRSRDSGLEIHNITLAQAGEYECVAKTSVGRISTKTHLFVYGPPGAVGGVEVYGDTSSAVIRWTDGATNGDPIRMYMVEGRTNWNQTWAVLAMNATAKDVDRLTSRKELQLTNTVSPFSTYEFRISAANTLGYGPSSIPSPTFNTRSDRIYIPPANVGGGGGKTGDLTITWKPFVGQQQNASGVYYKVFWRRLAGVDADVTEESEYQSQIVKNSRLAGLFVATVDRNRRYYYTPYKVKVQGCNDVGCGQESPEVSIYSAEDVPQIAPNQVAARAFNSTALNVTWLPMDLSRKQMRGKMIGFRIKYWRRQDKEDASVFYLSRSTRNEALIVGLMPDTYYWVRVMAYNGAGEGPQSERFLERTFKKAPLKPPTTVQVVAVNPSTVRVTWRYVAPSIEEEPLIGYKVRVWESDQDMSTANDTLVPLGRKLEAFVTSLSWGKRYNLRVLAYSQGGDGKMSSPTWVFRMGDDSDVNSSVPLNMAIFVLLASVILSICQTFTYNFALYT